jgi:predicted amidohydrolase
MYRDPLIDVLVNPAEPYLDVGLGDLPPEIVRDHLLRAMLAAHLAQRAILPMERLPAMPTTSSRLTSSTDGLQLRGLGGWLKENLSSSPATIGRYGALLVYAITLWRGWRQGRQAHLPSSPGFALLAPRTLFLHQDLEVTDPDHLEWRRTLRVRLAPTGRRPLRERWESAPAKAYREPITHAEVLDGLTFIVENELHPLRWKHIHPWISLNVVRPLSAHAATERRAPRVWLFPLRPTPPELRLIERDKTRPWTYGFTAHHTTPKAQELREIVWLVKSVVGESQDLSRDVLVFPELSLGPGDIAELRAALKAEGLKPGILIAGSHHSPSSGSSESDPNPPMLANAPVFSDGEEDESWCHQKRGPFRVTKELWKTVKKAEADELPKDAEIWEHIKPGDTFTTFDGPGGRVGVLICADLLEERFPAMRDVVRLSGVDLLVVVNYSQKTTLFMRHAEQLNRLGVCVIFLNAMTAVLGAKSKDKIDPFTVLVALPELKSRSSSKPGSDSTEPDHAEQPAEASQQEQEEASWLLWGHAESEIPKLMVMTRTGWKAAQTEALGTKVLTFPEPAAFVVDLNAWLVDPAESVTDDDPVMTALGETIWMALNDNTSPIQDRIAALREREEIVLPNLGASLPKTARTLLHKYSRGGLFEPTAAEHEDTLKSLFAMRLARPHRLASPPDIKDADPGKAESHFIVSLTPLGRALVERLPKATRSTRTGSS